MLFSIWIPLFNEPQEIFKILYHSFLFDVIRGRCPKSFLKNLNIDSFPFVAHQCQAIIHIGSCSSKQFTYEKIMKIEYTQIDTGEFFDQ